MTSLPSWKHKAHRTKPQNPRPNDFQHAYSRNVAFSTNVEHSSANNLFSSKQIACPHQMNFRRIEFTSLLSYDEASFRIFTLDYCSSASQLVQSPHKPAIQGKMNTMGSNISCGSEFNSQQSVIQKENHRIVNL